MSITSRFKIACVVPTYNGRTDLVRLLNSLRIQRLDFDLHIVDSSSSDGTFEIACEATKFIYKIPTAEFNHGGTRQLIVDINKNYDIFIFLTQDSYLADEYALTNIITPFQNEYVGAICGRQLPHLNASKLAQHARIFNYPVAGNEIRSLDDVPRLGIKAAFVSNSFTAYRSKALNSVGGFPSHVILSEDMYVAAKMLMNGWLVGYSGVSCCYHSHNYSLIQEFKRYFDQGVFHGREPWIRAEFGGAGGEGIRYVKSELKFLGLESLYLWPSSILRNGLKLIGYKLGQFEAKFPNSFKRNLSMHYRYWL